MTKACREFLVHISSNRNGQRAKKVPSSGKSPCIPFYLTLCTAFRMRLIKPNQIFWPCKKKNAENPLALLNQSPELNLIENSKKERSTESAAEARNNFNDGKTGKKKIV